MLLDDNIEPSLSDPKEFIFSVIKSPVKKSASKQTKVVSLDSTSGLSQSQLIQLKSQIMAYRMLARQQPLPKQIIAVSGRRQEPPAPALWPPGAPPSSVTLVK